MCYLGPGLGPRVEFDVLDVASSGLAQPLFVSAYFTTLFENIPLVSQFLFLISSFRVVLLPPHNVITLGGG